ncbi:hypothetical protein KAT80_03550 [Candidatus Pacearchaeota archaeon]|nr:hypothetical protein [Candidatus Pacearchaeota archaeon]
MCQLCEKKQVYEFTNQRKLCKTCFVRWFQKKVLYTIRKFKMISKAEVVGYENFGGFREVVLEDVLKMFAERAIVELVKLPISTLRAYTQGGHENLLRGPEKFSTKIFTKGKEVNKIAIASTTDLEADKIIHFLIKGGKKLEPVVDLRHQAYPSVRHSGAKIIKPLYLFLDKEVLLYAKLRNLKFKKTNVKLDEISKFINELEKTHPEVKQAVVGSLLGV